MHTSVKEGTSHRTLIEKVQIRRDELEHALAEEAADRADIESALASVRPMLTGDLDNLPDMVSRDLVRWLEINKYVGVNTEVRAAAPAAPAVKPEGPAAPAVKPEGGPEGGPDPDHGVAT